MAPPLTRRQQEIFDFLCANWADFEHRPNLNELCRALGLKSRGSLHKHIRALTDAGLIEPMNGKQRGIILTPKALEHGGDRNTLPLLGYIAAGKPIDTIEDERTVSVPVELRTKGHCYVLQVRGDSMIEDGILDGDWVVVEHRESARNGEVVVALIDETEATLKRIEQRPGRTVLHPANSAMVPLAYAPERVRIQGVLVGQMRRYV